ncbi:UNVERIFIED_CONTAM: carboxyl-terminal processing protease [Acetivibrio alkalicellulosi]
MNNNNFFTSKFVSVTIAVITSVAITASTLFIWYNNNPKYIIIPVPLDEELVDVSNHKDIDLDYAILFDKDKVDYENIRKYIRVRNILNNYFYKEVDANKLLEGSIVGMTNSLEDPYTVYFTKEQMELFQEKSQGSYVGIGVSVQMGDDGILTVIQPFEDSPAINAGIKMGDKITEVDGVDVTTIGDDSLIVSMIKGAENTDVEITVFRPIENRFIDFVITRERIKIVNIKSEMFGNIGYIRLSMFDSEIAKYFGSYLNEFIGNGMEGLIIDVRDNPGGDFDQVAAIANRLLPRGLIVYTEDRAGNRIEKKSDSTQLDMPIAVLINGYSASASEILAGAIKDHNKGTLIGTRTFGKGLVQQVVNLDGGAGLKFTIAEYFTPAGISIHEKGIEPHIEIDVDEDMKNLPVSQIPFEDDVQLSKAIEVIKEQILKNENH